MDIVLFIISVLFIWTVISVVWFYRSIGRKHEKNNKWYDYILSPPILLIAFVVGYLTREKK